MKLLRLGASTTLIAGATLAVAAGLANAETHHKLQKGENLSLLAQRYHVSVEAILKVNHLGNGNTVGIGTVVTIPDPPKHVVVHGSLYLPRQIVANRVSVRMGPGEQHPLMTCIDSGTHVIVTARRDGWSQVALASGTVGWVRNDFVGSSAGKTAPVPATRIARVVAKPQAAARAKHLQRIASAAHTQRKHNSGRAVHAPSRRMAAKTKRDQQLASAARRHRLEVAQAARVASAATHHRLAVAHAARLASAALHHRLALSRHSNGAVRAAKPVRVAMASGRSRSGAGTRGVRIVKTAFAYRGTPYVYGGSGRGGFDCSGFTRYVFAKHGVSLPHSARAQFQLGTKVSYRSLKAGDLVFFHTVTPGISHVGVYVGNGRFVHASSRRSGGVREDSLSSGYYRTAFRGARRVR
ncbi:MAG: C40 family peptidase [Armatimonadetes bacterium]|nr:C40 family peptidase [Armatimonadota bacterium]MDE2206647.1 C40 family peptidase [Armatimonadota bacterium]